MLAKSALIALALFAVSAPAACQPSASRKIVGQINGPDGSWDYASFDAAKRRVLISRGYGVMAIDVDSQAVTRLAPGDHVHANVLLPDGRLLITNGDSNTVTLANGTTGAIEATIPAAPHPDAAVYDPASGQAFVMDGASGFVTVVDLVEAKELTRISIGGKLEFAVVDGAGTLFVNVEDKAQIAVIDTKTHKAKTTFKLAGCEEPSGLAYVAPYRILISACANGHAKVLGADDGHEVADIEIGPHPDAVLYDKQRGVAFIPSAGSITKNGEITVLRIQGPSDVSVTDRIATQRGARTIAEDPKTGRLYLPTANYTIGLNGKPHPVDGTFRVLVVAPLLSRSAVPSRERSAYWTANRRHSSGTPLSVCAPRSPNFRPEPPTRSLTVLETSTSSGSANAATRAPMWTAMPTTLSPESSHSPVCRPVRT